MQSELDQLREEVIYLKVKMQKERYVDDREGRDVENRIQQLRDRARQASAGLNSPSQPVGTTGSTESPRTRYPTTSVARPGEVPEGTEIDVRLDDRLSSETARVEDRVEATTVADLYNGNTVIIPAGSRLRGTVTAVDKAGRIERKGRVTVSFDRITIRGRMYDMRGTPMEALESAGIEAETGRIATGAGVGAIIGGILGGLRGAITGVLVGAGGVIAATDGEDVDLAPGTILRVRFESALRVR
jgi:type IV secretory pathway VirB10-like protein